EAAGLVVGVIALAGIFNDCLEGLSHISALRSMRHDAELLNTKLDVEKALFLQWAERVRLVQSDCDRRLLSGSTAQTVEKILRQMRQLTDIISEYGLRPQRSDDDVASGANLISGPRMLDFTNSFERLQVGARNTDSEVMAVRQKRLSVFSKVRWVALDKEKFESLLNDISYFIAKLNELVPPIAHSYQGGVLANFRQDSLPLIPALAQEQSVVVAGKSGLEQFHTRLLNRLWFRKIAERREYIHPAHSATLKWVFTPPSPDQGWTDLSHWLRSGSGIYWISGKAGSGKSTLMKYLVDHVTTKSLLATWAAGVELVTPHFFFYYLGTREQKSLTGLTRTLLYDILSHNKSWIPELLPGMWKETLAASDDQSIDLPTHSEVISAFLALGQLPVKLCVFVDGLDEYDCDNLEVISFIQSLARSPNIKLVVSSRPEPEFIESFSGHPMLRMQEATQDDITLYVRDKLGSHRYMTALLERPDTRLRALGLMDTLCEKADGVFIWVVLASMSLERGFVNKDRIQELERRIAELPRELTDMFVHMMGRVSKGYQQQGAKYLRICFDSVQNERPGYLRLAGFALVDRNHQNHAACSLVDENMMEGLGNLCEDFAGRLNSRCGGLLEITSREEFLISEVVFFHRTVVEFLQTEGAWDLDLLQIRDASFNSHLALSSIWMYTAQLPFLTSGWCIGVALKWLSDALTMGQQPVDTVISFILTWQDVLLHAESEQVFRNITSANTTNRGKERVPVPDEIGLVIVIELGIVEIFDFYAQRHGLTEHLHRRRGRYPLVYHALYRPFV
ncbi:prion-inhibition and propagation-domain-containing protein, partial [Triangularia verruculosa]